jgi:ABC-type polysaccharide/polyol phosphate transport system ATPase subunit
MSIISVEHVVKEFTLGAHGGLREGLVRGARRLLGREVEAQAPFRALDDVSFKVEAGEVLGIIGHNGAGKSTLLKLISRISVPTRGHVSVAGRIAPLIEVGAGFVPDFTGRENVYLNGTILGMSRREIDRKFDEIVAFSEIGEFIDTPVKRYSSGMQVKLAFAVATAVESEILVVDEVLAVGDVAFQRKCLDRMEQLISRDGRTVLLVGHNIRQLERICSRMIMLKGGQIVEDGEPGEVCKRFLDEATVGRALIGTDAQADDSLRPGFTTGEVELIGITLGREAGDDGDLTCELFDDLTVRLSVFAHQALRNVEIQLGLHGPDMVFVTKSSSRLMTGSLDLEAGLNEIEFVLEGIPLCPGTYGVGMTVFDWAHRRIWNGNRLRWIEVKAAAEKALALPAGTLTYLPARWSHVPGTMPRT